VDGEDTPASHRAVDAHLTGCPPCRAEADAESAGRDLMRSHKHELAAQAPEALRARCAASLQLPAAGSRLSAFGSQLPASRRFSSGVRRWVPLSLAATLVLAVAGVFLFGLNDRVEALAASLAMDHSRCFKVYGTATDADPVASERTWQQDQGWPIVVPPTEAAQQLKLVNVRRCFTIDGRSAHMMYTWKGEPLSVYVLQGDAGRDGIVHKLGAQAVVWCANQRTYAVVANDTGRDLTPIVDYMRTRVH